MRLSRILCAAFVLFLCSVSNAAAKTPTVASEIDRLVAAGTVAPEAGGAYRATYDDAKTRLKKLTGARSVNLGGVIHDLDGMAARSQLEPSRLPALFLTLQRNVQFWTTAPLPAAGYRTSFTGSELVYQFYPGHGMQIQWLGTFGKLNGYWTGGKRYDARAGALLDEIKSLASERAGGLAWEYLFPFDGQSPPWVSSLAQATGLQAMARSATRLNRQEDVFPVALAGLKIFQAAPPTGVRIRSGNGAHYLQYSGLAKLKILNGFIQSLVGLYDFANLTGDATALSLFQDGDRAGRAEVGTFDTGAWSLYSRGSSTRESDLSYHTLLRDFLTQLCTRTQAPQYCSAEQHFTAYLTTPPVLTYVPARGKVRFKLSKISRVAVTIKHGSRVVSTLAPGVLGRGTKTFSAPKKAGTYAVTVSATDLAGNPATTTGKVTVKKRG
jgi:D-glucuronyl C5-epimerase C-terminus